MDQNDLLKKTLLRFAEQIHAKEIELARVSSELEALRNKVKTLDEARAIIAEAISAPQAYAEKQAAAAPQGLSLQEEVLRSLHSPFASPTGNTVSEVAGLLKELDYPASTSKSFYAAVYTTLRRLAERGEIDSFPNERGRMFRAKDATANLFENQADGGAK